MAPDKKLKVGILGATGTVGQKFILLLQNHPWFEIAELGASEASAGKKYADIVKWKQSSPIPASVKDMVIKTCSPELYESALVFSGLDSNVAGEVEIAFAKRDIPVFSNARNHRYDPDVPILIPGANANHIDIIPSQRKNQGYKRGFIVTNANCSSTGLVIALKPLEEAFGIDQCLVVTMQAISGAGYPGVPSLDITDNVIPYIDGEEPKMEKEPQKILGLLKDGSFQPAPMAISAHCNRVHVIDGHTECVSLRLRKPGVTPEAVKEVLRNYRTADLEQMKLPSLPSVHIIVREEKDRPQPRLDREAEKGFAVSVGRIRECPLFGIKFTLLSHNTVIGAAGGSILNAELAYAKGYLSS
mmetsp:Transcript_268/g.513  ORF Transcript_268/g.513 Transcript_268/m.513 type:complete len:358 (+) Transcript_268:101-1174(+)|eukprot:CAMPEP_0184672252 /NCGR_PEP_ID=MMETSP0308-20130426/85990_1 /TAXON_ID=38269 /ORGANISM="Gloeochaete witrockiana, Strain SAG 46.84" /LENGTH=357 /DNA_ID=CAMNT_0027119545 /DNA_START=23 /DNA_END=1096 /DNA_ORIENTATION=+